MEGEVEDPVQSGLDVLVAADDLIEPCGVGRQAGEGVAGLSRDGISLRRRVDSMHTTLRRLGQACSGSMEAR